MANDKRLSIVHDMNWDTCYLHQNGQEKRRNQVIRDLKKEIQKSDLKVGDFVTVWLEDHSTGFEQFEVVQLGDAVARLEYIGGGS